MKQKSKENYSPRSGITILEILVVLVIVGLVASLVAPRLLGYVGRARGDAAEIQIGNIQTALDLYYIDLGRYPGEVEGLAALVTAPAVVGEWDGPYMQSADALTDPWGRAYVYAPQSDGSRPVVQSLGRDGLPGGSGEDADLSG